MFYVFHGDDAHSQKKTLGELQLKLGEPSLLELNTTRFDGRHLSMSELIHACESVPFLADKRLVIVQDLASSKSALMDELLAYLPSLPDTARLVFLESRTLPPGNPLLKLAKKEKSGYVKLFERLEGARLSNWIRKRVEDGGGHISNRAIHSLTLDAGDDLFLLENEIEKLLLYKGKETIEVEDVALLCPYVAEASIFDLVDAIGSRHGRAAARLLAKKLEEGSEPFYLFAMVVRQFRLIIQVKELAGEGLKAPEIARELKLHGFVAGKLLQQSHNFSRDQLETIYAHLLEMDVGSKTGQTDMVTALNLLVAGLTV